MKKSVTKLTYNPEMKPYHVIVFESFKIFVIYLYMGANKKLTIITKDVFLK
jgi:hypothetical protein